MTDDRLGRNVLTRARCDCERRLESGEPLHLIEQDIDQLPVPPDARAALWLWCLAYRDRADDRSAAAGRRG